MEPILLAHTVAGQGVSLEFLLIAGALLVVGIIGFFQKSVKPVVSVVLVAAAVALGAGAFVFAPDAPTAPDGAAVQIMSPADGDEVAAGEQIELELDISNFMYHSGSGGHAGHGGGGDDMDVDGHVHIYVDGEEVAMASSDTVPIELTEGEHLIEAELVDPEHAAFDPQVRHQIVVDAVSSR